MAIVFAFLALCAAAETVGLSVAVVDRCRPNPQDPRVPPDVWQALATAGHKPFVLSNNLDRAEIAAQVAMSDLVLFCGGEDVDPARYGETPSPRLGTVNRVRDAFEYGVLDEAVKIRKPLFGICRGSQLLNCYFGGTLVQDIPSEVGTNLVHSAPNGKAHVVKPVAGSRLAAVLGEDERMVVSWHHQAVERFAKGFRVSARSSDGVVEAYESDDYPVAGVQFHPEMDRADCPSQTLKAIFERLDELVNVKKARK